MPDARISKSILILAATVLAASSGLAQTSARDFCNRGVDRQKKGDLDGALADYTRAIELNPQNALAYNNRGLVKIAKGDTEGALSDYDRALQISPRNFEIRTNRGVARQRSGDLEGALSDYNIALKLYHKYYLAYSARANLRLAQNDPDGALADCNLAIDYNSKDAAAYNTRGLIERAKGNIEAATADFNRASKLDSKYARNNPPASKTALTPPPAVASQPSTGNTVNAPFATPVETGTLAVEPKKPEVAKSRDLTPPNQSEVKVSRPEPDFAPPSEVEPQDIVAAYDRDLSKNKQGAPTPAVPDQTPGLESTVKPADVAAVGGATSKPPESVAHAQVSPTVAGPSTNLEAPRSLELRHPDTTAVTSETTLPTPPTETKKLEPSDNPIAAIPKTDISVPPPDRPSSPEPSRPTVSAQENSPNKTEADLNLAMANRNQPAEPQLSPLAGTSHFGAEANNLTSPPPTRTPPEHEPSTATGFDNRAHFRRAIGDLKGALADETHAIHLDPKYAPAYIGRGEIRRAKHDFDGALTDYNRAIELDGGNAFAYYSRGLTKQSKGDVNGAIADFNPALQLDPKSAGAYHSRGAARAMKGDLEGALADYNKAIELDPNDAATHSNRGGLYFSERNWEAALADYTHCFELSKEGQDYPRLYIWLIRTRTGQTDTANKELIDYVQQRGNTTDWYSQIAGYLLGGKSEDALWAAARSPDKNKENGQLCEGWFYVGMKKLLSGDTIGAKDCFNKVIATGQKDFAEYHFARAEVKALQK